MLLLVWLLLVLYDNWYADSMAVGSPKKAYVYIVYMCVYYVYTLKLCMYTYTLYVCIYIYIYICIKGTLRPNIIWHAAIWQNAGDSWAFCENRLSDPVWMLARLWCGTHFSSASPQRSRHPATWKHGWSKHGFSRLPSKYPQVANNKYICNNHVWIWWYSAKTMFTPTMFFTSPGHCFLLALLGMCIYFHPGRACFGTCAARMAGSTTAT